MSNSKNAFARQFIRRLSMSALALSAMPVSAACAQEADEELVVIGYRAQNQQAIAAKRLDERVMEYLSSDDIGQQPDYNIADSFRRLPGIQTVFDEDEGRYVAIRGLNPSYTLGSLDGSTLATAERGNRQLNMESIPSTAVRSVEVIKSRTPDTDGNAIGGTLNLVTRSAFDQDGLYAAGNFFIGTSDSQDVPGEGFNRDSDDGLNYRFDGTLSTTFGANDQFGILVSANYSLKRRDQERLLPQSVPLNVTAAPTPVSALTGQTDLLWSTYPNSVDRYGGTVKFEYQPTNTFSSGVAFTFFQQDDNELRHSQRLRNGTGGSASFVRFNDYPLEKPLFVGQAFAEWDLDDNQRLDARIAYSEATFSEPSNEVLFNLASPAAGFNLDLDGAVPVGTNLDPRLNDPTRYAFASYAPYEDDSDEYVTEGQINYGFNTERGDDGWGFGFGAKYREITRNNDRTQNIWLPAAGAALNLSQFDQIESYTPIFANFQQQFVDFQSFLDYFNANRAQFQLDAVNSNRQSIGSDWVVEETVGAIYALARHAGPNHSIIFGGRWEQTETSVDRISRKTIAGADVFSPVSQDGEYDNFLPSITISYNLTDDLKLRAGMARAVGRPNLSSLGGAETVASDGTISRGNANLEARLGDSVEASLEYYLPGDAGLIALAVFHKDIENEIVTRSSRELIDGVLTTVNQPINGDEAEVRGLEVSFVKNTFDMLPGFLANFGVSANATWIQGETSLGTPGGLPLELDYLQGQAQFLGNVALFYEDGPLQARATYAYIGEYVTATSFGAATLNGLATQRVNNERFDAPTRTLDLQARYSVLENLELIGEVRNFTGENKVNYFNDATTGVEYIRDISTYGRQFWIGAAFKY